MNNEITQYRFPAQAYSPAPQAVRSPLQDKLTAVMNGIQEASTPVTVAENKFEVPTAWKVAAAISSPLCAYHGYKRNKSIGWAIWWSLMGGMFPIFTPVIAVAQGFGKEK